MDEKESKKATKKASNKKEVLKKQTTNKVVAKNKVKNEVNKNNEEKILNKHGHLSETIHEISDYKHEKQMEELNKLKEELSEIKVNDLLQSKSTPILENKSGDAKLDSHLKENIVNENIEEIQKQKGELTIEAISSKDVIVQEKIEAIKSELKAKKTVLERIKDVFKPRDLKKQEQELIEKKVLRSQKINSQKEVKFILTHFKSTIGWFSVFYSRSGMGWRIGVAVLVGIIMSIVSILFVQNTGVILTGLSGLLQGFARITKTLLLKGTINAQTAETIYTSMFYGMYLLVSIPLIIFSYKKIGKNFTILSSIPVVLSSVIPLLINLIPNINELFVFGNTKQELIYIITNPQNPSELLLEHKDSPLNAYGVQILTFFHGTNDLNQLVTDGSKFGFMMMYTFASGICNGIAYAMALSVGGSTGGLDFISFYYSYKKNKSIGKILLFFNTASVIMTAVIGAYIPAGLVTGDYGSHYFFSQNLVSGIIYSIIITIIINQLFPKDKAVKITIYSEKVFKIRNYLYSKNFNHALTINTATGGYSLTEKKNIEIICMFIEIPKILNEIRHCDVDTLITITPLKGIEGKLKMASTIN